MKKISLLFLCLLVFSCTKDEMDKISTCQLASVIYGEVLSDQVFNVNYEDNLIVEMIGNTERMVFLYDIDGNLIQRNFFVIGNPQIQHQIEFKTNASGRVTEAKTWRFQNGSMEYQGMETYRYNGLELSEIDCFKADDISLINTYEFIWRDENPVSLTVTRPSGEIEYTTSLTYDMSVKNIFNERFPNAMFYYNFTTDFNIYQSLGKHRLISSSATFDPSNPTVATYNYTFLSNGLTDEVSVNGNLWWKYSYDCE